MVCSMPLALLLAFAGLTSAQYKAVNPHVSEAIAQVSEDRIAATLKKLESFQTRNLLSSEDDPRRGIGAARQWIFDQLKSYSPRLQVGYDKYRIKKIDEENAGVPHDVDLYNISAVLPGKGSPSQRILIAAHYDTIATLGDAGIGEPSLNPDPNALAPGVNDDGSGIACVLELARILSQYEFEKTLVFVAFSGEEQGMLGSTLYAAKARAERQKIEALLNNDIIGGAVDGAGEQENRRVRVFSDDPADSPSRELARYVREIGQRYVPSMNVDAIFRADRFNRGGDHVPFLDEGFAAVRMTSAQEDFSHQHKATDTFEHASVPYIARVTKVNGAVAASLAWAPKAPATSGAVEQDGVKRRGLLIGRGKSLYDSDLAWEQEPREPDLAGFVVVRRSTTAPYWEQETWVPTGTHLLLPGMSIDQYVFGVKAVDRDGNESLVSPYVPPPRGRLSVDVVLSDEELGDDR
jgi:Peptidase family M28